MTGPALVCPTCATGAAQDERFCADCGMPLVFAPLATGAAPAPTERQERARKVKRQYSDGPLVRVAVGRHQAEAELIQGLLLDYGVPSMTKRSAGFDVPDMLFSGPRDVLVPGSGAEAAREVLGGVEREHAAVRARQSVATGHERGVSPRAGRSTRTLAVVVSVSLVVLALGPLIAILLRP